MKLAILHSVFLLTFFTSYGQTVEWLATPGNINADRGQGITTDADGNVYATGEFRGKVDFDPGVDTFYMTSLTDSANVYVVKYNTYGELMWATSLGIGSGYDITLDHDGNVDIVGYFRGTSDFDPGPNMTILTSSNGSIDIFIAQLNNTGVFQWVKGIGGTGTEVSKSIALDADDNIYTTGYFHNTVDFDPGPGVDNETSAGGSDIYIQKLSQTGIHIWAKRIGASLLDTGTALSIDQSGNLIFTGGFHGMVDFDPDSGTQVLIADDSIDVFICALNGAGNFMWAKSFGGTHEVIANDMILDAQDNIFLTGYFIGVTDFNPDLGYAHLTAKGGADVYISKLDASANFLWVKQIGGVGDEEARVITLDGEKNIYLAGGFQNICDFDPGTGTYSLTAYSSTDMFVTKLSSIGNFIAVHKIGGYAYDVANGLAIDEDQKALVSGIFTDSADFDTGRDTFWISTHGQEDAFIVKMNFLPFISDFEGNLAPCADQTTTYSINAENVNQFSWSFPSGWQVIGSANNDTVQVKASSVGGLITVTASGVSGSTVPLSIVVDPVSKPVLSALTGIFAPCPGEMQTYFINDMEVDSFSWSFPADWQVIGNTNNDTVHTIVGLAPGIISVSGFNACGDTLIQRNVNTRRLPVITNFIGDLSPCVGDTISYRVQQMAVNTFEWMLPPGWELLGVEDTNIVSVVVGNAGGIITVTGTNVCGDTTWIADVNPIAVPEVHLVVVNMNTITVTVPAQSYQWFINSISIPGATTASYTATQSGSYYVVLNFAGGCSTHSDTVLITITGLQDEVLDKIKVYPVPVQDQLYIEGIDPDFQFVIYDAAGRKVMKGKTMTGSIDLSKLVAGGYVVEVMIAGKKYAAKFLR